jgi:hypothetical protein
MNGVDLSALTVPVFTAVFGMGWGACHAVLVRPMKQRLDEMEARLSTVEAAKDARIAALEKALNIPAGG